MYAEIMDFLSFLVSFAPLFLIGVMHHRLRLQVKNANGEIYCHLGEELVTYDQLFQYTPPPPQGPRHRPVAHGELAQLVKRALDAAGLELIDEAFAIAKEGQRMAGLLAVDAGVEGSAGVVALLSANDQSEAIRLSAGQHVWVCANTAITGDRVIRTLHTTHVMDRLPGLIGEAVGGLVDEVVDIGPRTEAYRRCDLSPKDAHDTVVRALDQGCIVARDIRGILDLHRGKDGRWGADHDTEYGRDNAWRLYNAFTEEAKRVKIGTLTQRTIALTGLFDALAGYESQLARAQERVAADVEAALTGVAIIAQANGGYALTGAIPAGLPAVFSETAKPRVWAALAQTDIRVTIPDGRTFQGGRPV